MILVAEIFIFTDGCGFQGASVANAAAASGPRAGRILGGMDVVAGKYPWMAAVITMRKDGTVKRCGGTLIKPQWVLTSANCVADKE